jgi:hypothetical protein
MTIEELAKETTEKALLEASSYGEAQEVIAAALRLVLKDCAAIARAVQDQSGALMKVAVRGESQQYYRGRGLGAAAIEKRILARTEQQIERT